jgi:hypothetical protein
MALTLNQIIKRVTDYGNQHAQINFVYFGAIYNRLSESDVTYPAMFFDIEDSRILAKQTEFRFSFYFVDRQLQETEGTEIMSDMVLVAQDIVAQLRNNYNEWDVSEDIPMDFLIESDPDYIAGVRIEVSLTIPNINNRCVIPTN